MRLTADMIARSPAFFNACREREIDLRGNKIAVIENLAATQNQFDSIDLSDNEIRKLESMARLPRVTMLLLSNNRISRVDENVGQAFPKLEHLVLTNNHFATLKELEALAALQSLKTLSLVDNKVTKVENYRAFVISLLPNLKILDFQKIKPREREEVEAAYGGAAKRPRLECGARRVGGRELSTFVPGQPGGADAAAAPAARRRLLQRRSSSRPSRRRSTARRASRRWRAREGAQIGQLRRRRRARRRRRLR